MESLDHSFVQPAFRGEGVPVKQTANPELGLVIGASQHRNTEEKRFDLSIVDLDDPAFAFSLIPMTFFGHGIARHPADPARISIFEKRGPGACEINLKEGRVTRPIVTADDRQFYGHGAYSTDGKLLYSTETIMNDERTGLIAVRDAESHEYLGEFPSHGASPHDCHLLDDGKTMVITNGGGDFTGSMPNVTFVDVNTEQLIEKLEPDYPRVNSGHVSITASGKLAMVSAPREGLASTENGGITIRLGNGKFHTLRKPSGVIKRLRGETLSVCIHDAGNVVGATTPDANLLTFWNLASGELICSYDISNPRGIELTADGKYFIVSHGAGTIEALSLIDTDSLELVRNYDMSPVWITGSHLFSYVLPPELRQ